jgi:hypothetical protein
MQSFVQLVVAALISGAVASSIIGVIFRRYVTRVEQEVRSQRAWKERSLTELLGPVNMQLERTERAFHRWTKKNLYLEAKVVGEGNRIVRDLLLQKGHLIPPDLLGEAAKLVEHYDVWLEKYETQRLAEKPHLEAPFTFVGPQGYPFPKGSANSFQQRFQELWKELYGDG